MDLVMGAAPRQRREPTGLCLVEIDSRRDQAGKRVDHYVVRYLERLPPGTSFPAMAQRFGEVAAAVSQRTGSRPVIYVDATGYGQPFINEVKRAGSYTRVRPVFFTHGDRRVEEGGEVRLGKCWLVTQVQMLLQTHQLHLPRSPEAERLAEELADYEVQVAADANDRYGAFRVGSQDELVTALGLAVQKPPSGRVEHAWIHL
jgi:hypothetical protein